MRTCESRSCRVSATFPFQGFISLNDPKCKFRTAKLQACIETCSVCRQITGRVAPLSVTFLASATCQDMSGARFACGSARVQRSPWHIRSLPADIANVTVRKYDAGRATRLCGRSSKQAACAGRRAARQLEENTTRPRATRHECGGHQTRCVPRFKGPRGMQMSQRGRPRRRLHSPVAHRRLRRIAARKSRLFSSVPRRDFHADSPARCKYHNSRLGGVSFHLDAELRCRPRRLLF